MKEDNTIDKEIDDKKPKPAPTAEEEPSATLKEMLEQQATEEEDPMSATFTLRRIIGGEFLDSKYIRRQVWVIVIIIAYTIFYITNRYNVQKDLIELDKLQDELQDAKYKALSASSAVTEKSRESNVLNMLKDNKDSVLQIATQPPYIINVPEK